MDRNHEFTVWLMIDRQDEVEELLLTPHEANAYAEMSRPKVRIVSATAAVNWPSADPIAGQS